ncbi:MAG: thiamine pyrophosphate-dependent dehydrogenase E1 component subunit alpha [bacterium]|nr:thiamine pyrophosphate-dependent dehydrogenase E1 component subunit alpha [bacterium]
MKPPAKKKMVAIYRTMLKIRMVEEKLMEVFANGEIPGFIHVCIGQEATPAAVCSHLKNSDYIASTHRGHGHALAKGMELKPFMAELFGRRNGPCRGRSGSMHLADKDLGILGANGIVGGGLPIANGAALASKHQKQGRVTVCFFGEGATSEGTFHEALNIAAVMRLPIIFVCENNGWAEFTPQKVHLPVTDVAQRAAAYNIPGIVLTNDGLEIYGAAGRAVQKARRGQGPTLLEIKSARWHGHYVGDVQKYRPSKDIEQALKSDCIARFEDRLLKDKIVDHDETQKIRQRLEREIESAFEFARQSPFPESSELMADLYA